MKVLFLQNVRPTARAGDVKEVKLGFARNFLIPQGFAVQATEHELRRASALRTQAEDRRLVEAKEWQDIADALKDRKVRIDVRTGPTGRLYGSVTNTMIAAKVSEMTEREIDRRGIQIPAPIRTVGEHKVPARFVEGVTATLVIEVVPDEASIELNRQMNATLEGQTTAHYLAERLEDFPLRITQLAHGLPVGGELDYLDEGTLAQALRARRPVS